MMDLCDPQDQVIEAAVQRLVPSPLTGKEHMLIGFDRYLDPQESTLASSRQGDGKRSSKVSHLAGRMGRCNDCPCSWRGHWMSLV